MAQRQALLLADTGNDRLCLVNLVSRAELRLERKKQAMLRRQMRALHRQQRAAAAARAAADAASDGSSSSSSALGGLSSVFAAATSSSSSDSDCISSSSSGSDSSSDEDDPTDSYLAATRSGSSGLDNDSGPLVGHVETVRVRGLLPAEYDGHFIRTPWSPWSDMAAAASAAAASTAAAASSSTAASSSSSAAAAEPTPASTLRQRHNLATRSDAMHMRAASSALANGHGLELPTAVSSPVADDSSAAGSSSPSARPPLTPLPFVHRGQNTFVRKLVVTSQGKIIALNRLGLQCMRWAKDPSMD